jgi:hypothetical protein
MCDKCILRGKAREVILAGTLDRPPDRIWGGAGGGAPCLVCGKTVQHGEVGLEIEYTLEEGAGANSYQAHVACYSALEHALAELELARQTLSGSDYMQAAPAVCTAGGQNGTRS